jgi:hypothetical protein
VHTSVTKRLFAHGRSRMIGFVIVTAIVCSAASAGAAALITGADVKDGSLTGKDIKNGSLAKGDLDSNVGNALSIRVTGGLPTQTFKASNDTVKNTKDGVEFGPYADGGTEGGSVCTSVLNGDPFSDVKHLAFEARYTATGSTGGVGVPYLRVFLVNNTHDAIFSPNTQAPDPDIDEGPFHTWVATAGSWRYDDDSGSGPDSPFAQIRSDHATEKISKICVSVGNSNGTDLSGLLRTLEMNGKDYSFGL